LQSRQNHLLLFFLNCVAKSRLPDVLKPARSPRATLEVSCLLSTRSFRLHIHFFLSLYSRDYGPCCPRLKQSAEPGASNHLFCNVQAQTPTISRRQLTACSLRMPARTPKQQPHLLQMDAAIPSRGKETRLSASPLQGGHTMTALRLKATDDLYPFRGNQQKPTTAAAARRQQTQQLCCLHHVCLRRQQLGRLFQDRPMWVGLQKQPHKAGQAPTSLSIAGRATSGLARNPTHHALGLTPVTTVMRKRLLVQLECQRQAQGRQTPLCPLQTMRPAFSVRPPRRA
jgi:hypothetical protein